MSNVCNRVASRFTWASPLNEINQNEHPMEGKISSQMRIQTYRFESKWVKSSVKSNRLSNRSSSVINCLGKIVTTSPKQNLLRIFEHGFGEFACLFYIGMVRQAGRPSPHRVLA